MPFEWSINKGGFDFKTRFTSFLLSNQINFSYTHIFEDYTLIYTVFFDLGLTEDGKCFSDSPLADKYDLLL